MDPIVAPQSLMDAVVRLLLAALLGAVVGADREFHDKPAGLRTHALVSVGAALATVTSLLLAGSSGLLDANAASRVLQGVLAGVGFVGVGVILQRNDSRGVHGLTTAASVWVVASVGVAAGLGQWRLGLATTIIVLLLLVAERPVERIFRARQRRNHHEPDGT
jgi:putative Mg2+ transporter-C (MgtC) family protein